MDATPKCFVAFSQSKNAIKSWMCKNKRGNFAGFPAVFFQQFSTLKVVENYVEYIDLWAINLVFSTRTAENGGIITLFSFFFVENHVESVEKPQLWHNALKRLSRWFLVYHIRTKTEYIILMVYYPSIILTVFVNSATLC